MCGVMTDLVVSNTFWVATVSGSGLGCGVVLGLAQARAPAASSGLGLGPDHRPGQD